MVLDAMNVSYDGVAVKVELDRSDDAKTVFKYQIDIKGSIDEETKGIVFRKVMNCPVKKRCRSSWNLFRKAASFDQ